MVSRNSPCDSNRLRRFLDAPYGEDGGTCELADHLEHCEKCRSELEALAGGRWWNEVRPYVKPSSDDEPGIQTQAAAPPAAEDSDLNFLSPSDQPGYLGRFGPYKVLGVLGKGGMGIVLKALDPALQRVVAIKVLSPLLATSGSSRQRFTREAQAAAAIVHNHVVPIFHVDTDKDSGLPYLVMQCIIGRSLQERIDRDGPLDMPAVLRIGTQAASGLAAAHAQGIVHRDVKPANILLENGIERVVLTDFSLARAVDDASLTQSGVIAGTPQYMSPEQSRGEISDHRSDLFSLGSVLYAMCSGHSPFRASSALAVLRRVSDDQPRPIRELNPAVPEELAIVIEKLHAKNPADRYQSASEVAEVLGQVLANLQKPTRRKAAPPAPQSRAMPRRRRWQPALVAGLILALFAGMFAGVSSVSRRMSDPVDTIADAQDNLRSALEEQRESQQGLREAQGSLRMAMTMLRAAGSAVETEERREAEDNRREAEDRVREAQDAVRIAGDNVRLAEEKIRVLNRAVEERARAVAHREEARAYRMSHMAAARPEPPAIPEPPALPIELPEIPGLNFAIPNGPLVKLDRRDGVTFSVTFGDDENTVVGSGKSETRTFDLKDFTSVEVRGPFQIELKQDKKFKVAVTADDNLFEHLQVEKVGKSLVIGFKGKNVSIHLKRGRALKAEISLPTLEGLTLTGAARANAEGFKSDQPVNLHLSGACQLTGSWQGDGLSVDANGASTLKLSGTGKDLRLRVSGASKLKMADFAASGKTLIINAVGASTVALKGDVTAAVIKLVGASLVDLHDVTLAAADVTAEGASHATVRVKEKLDYSVTGASHLDYYGDPAIGKADKHGHSHVGHMQ
jgi:serine/threonine-protein kinase